ncbi:MAG: 4-alpha-glucanotransferase [Myxococcales bacterium]|nr:4-alpha-glucanotransferase [Myxococcales bacterium]
MRIPRSSGILLHPTSLPGPYGVGDLGASARLFLDHLREAKQRWWQLLPLNPAGYGGSPYSATSAFAGNPLLIDLEDLIKHGWLVESDLDELKGICASLPSEKYVMEVVQPARLKVLTQAWKRWHEIGGPKGADYQRFCKKHVAWLDDYALFATLKEVFEDEEWTKWEPALVARKPEALAAARKKYAKSVERHSFWQWIFFHQWNVLREEARKRGISLIGDIPIFVAMDSADTWANREIFRVNQNGSADVVAGVPPDYFSETGQKWGNPLYRWDVLAKTDYRWWVQRIHMAMETVDLIRIDHFRGFESYWEVPAKNKTAIQGRWLKGPGQHFFDAIRRQLGSVPFIAEDLGMITDAVYVLRDQNELPGMKIVQFAFDEANPNHPFLPHTYPESCVAYTGTHDNDTTQGWYEGASEEVRHRVRTYFQHGDYDMIWRIMQGLLESRACLTIFPAQDLYPLGTWARMNVPGTDSNNWHWRMTQQLLDMQGVWQRLGQLTAQAHRG